MKKKLILVMIISISCKAAIACDICGCGVGGSYIGILPDFGKKILGLRYRYNTLRTHLGAGGMATYLTSDENYNTVELWGGWNIGKKFRLMGAVPFSFNERVNQGVSNSKNGFGDISLMGYYELLNKRKAILKEKLLVQSLWVGGGVKLPTGEYNPDDKQNTNQNANLFQLGTASVDFTLNAMYDVRLQDIGLNISASYKMNTANKYKYQYGNKLSSTAQLYYKIKAQKHLTLAPNVGVMYETSQKDIDGKFAVDISGGQVLMGTAGVESVFKKMAIGFNMQTPLTQSLANGFVKANNRVMVHVAFAL